jgi:hypothetical protein
MIKRPLCLIIMQQRIYQVLLIFLLSPVLACAVWCGINIDRLSEQRKTLKQDYAELNNIQYGLLSVNAWRDNITSIVSGQIKEFDLNKNQEKLLKVQLNAILNAMITQASNMVNEKQKTLGGKIKKAAVKTFVNFDKVRARVPEFSETILAELKKPQSIERMQALAQSKLQEFAEQTHDNFSSKSNLQVILDKHDAKNAVMLNRKISVEMNALQRKTYFYTYILLGCLIFFLALWLVLRKRKKLYTPMFVMSVLLALIVLCVGLSAPMIEIDARIKELNFTLIGKHMVFQDQVLFFQSKSILDVVHILISTNKVDSILVGFLILIFSVAFPIIKLICTKLYLLGNEKWRRNGVLVFFAFKSGKWSMADVMVVAIMMTYIGFKGILDNQLSGLNMQTDSLATIATNETSLQPGFLLFIAYVIFGLLLGVILKRITSVDYEKIKAERAALFDPRTLHPQVILKRLNKLGTPNATIGRF